MSAIKTMTTPEKMQALKAASFHIILHQEPHNPNRQTLSAICVRQLGAEVFIFDRVTDASAAVEKRVALPYESISDLMPLPLAELERQVGPRGNDKGRFEPMVDYFERAVAGFMKRQGVESIWALNKEGAKA